MTTTDDEIDATEVKESPIEGLGLFATREFVEGETIRRVNIVREITDADPIRPEAGERIEHCAYPDGKVVLWGYPDRHLNHSCDPNAYERYVDEHVEIVARRSIAMGEEITVDYLVNNAGGDSWPCQCGATRCRKITAGSFFDLPIEIQCEYRPLLAEWFVSNHGDRLARIPIWP
ncbi:MAG: hypothetical protein DCC49_02775 [Acidobacteria bacterium]|nr:MAG: hypothetical protein DCC49_02775 [Acidobacteriota bacterium]